jgi:uncharacterized protein YukE
MNLNLTVKVASVNVVVDESAVAGLESLLARLLGPLASDLLDPILDAHLSPLRESLMSALSDAIDRLETSVGDAKDRVQKDVSDLRAEIAKLQAQVAAGGADQATLDRLAALQAHVEEIDRVASAPLPTDTGGGATPTP